MSGYQYDGFTPVKRGDYVELCPRGTEWDKAKVVDALANQFTVKVGKRVSFFFYTDRGATWRKISE